MLPAQSSTSARSENIWLCLCFKAQGREEEENKPFKREHSKTTSSPNPPGVKKGLGLSWRGEITIKTFQKVRKGLPSIAVNAGVTAFDPQEHQQCFMGLHQ